MSFNSVENLVEFMETINEEFLKWDRVTKKRSTRPDIHAFILLNEIDPLNREIVAAAEHDEIFLDPEPVRLLKCTEETILELVRCGVRINSGESLAMFV